MMCNRGTFDSATAETLCFHADSNRFVDGLYGAGVDFDSSGNLWVADSGNNRVLRFPVSDGRGRLYVVDTDNDRVLVFYPPFTSGMEANRHSYPDRYGGSHLCTHANSHVDSHADHNAGPANSHTASFTHAGAGCNDPTARRFEDAGSVPPRSHRRGGGRRPGDGSRARPLLWTPPVTRDATLNRDPP